MNGSLSRLITAVSLATMPALVWAHGGEDHGEKKEAAAVVNARVMNRTAEVSGRIFKLIVTETPSDPRDGEVVQFGINLIELIEGGFAGGEIPVERARVTGRFLTSAGEPVSLVIEAHMEEEPGTYGLHTTFDDDGDYKLEIATVTEDGVEVRVDFPVPVTAAPINYWAFALDGLLLLIGLGFLGLSYSGARRQPRGSAPGRRLVPRFSVTVALLVAGLLTIHYFVPATLARADEARTSLTPASGTKEITIPKESQILFNIRTKETRPARIISGITANGLVKVRPQFRAEVVPPVSGRTRFASRRLTVGDEVHAGETLAVVEQVLSAPEVAALEATRTELQTKGKQFQSEAMQAKQRLDLAKIELERSRKLYEVGAAALRRVQDAELAVKLAREQHAAARAQVEITEVGQRRVNPVRTFPLRAPISGVITQVTFTPGQQVEPGESLFMVMDLRRVWIEAQIYESDLGAVTHAQHATFKVAAFPTETFPIQNNSRGKLLTVTPVVDPQSRTVPVIYEVMNPGGRLSDGMFAEITIDTTGGRQVLAVPSEAVVDDRGKKIVYVFAGGEHFEKRTVTLGAQGQTMTEITSGLKSGDRVVIEGIYQLRSVAGGV